MWPDCPFREAQRWCAEFGLSEGAGVTGEAGTGSQERPEACWEGLRG